MKSIRIWLMFLYLALAIITVFSSVAVAKTDNVVLVHGMNMDAGVWRVVHDRLISDGYNVALVQLPMTSVKADVAATQRIVDDVDGPVVLVGHSYGGMVISQAGTDPDVKALVYIAAFQPEVGESLAELNASVPTDFPQDALHIFDDGYCVVKPDAWIKYVANGLPEAVARYTALFQTPANTAIFTYKAKAAAWHNTPTWAAITTKDHIIAPSLQRKMVKRSGATEVDIDSGHLLPISYPNKVVALIEEAATAVN